jgi:lysosomal Pro-X carboxypeptidase
MLIFSSTGLMWENAKKFGALLVFAEHRYYGQSQPFGSDSGKQPYLQYLTHEQAMADYAALIRYLQVTMFTTAQPVIAFGGSYGGMLTAWLKIKYPSVFTGGIAASAPILAFNGMEPSFNSETYWRVVTRDASAAAGSAPACSSNVGQAWAALFAFAKTADGLAKLSQVFQLCTPLQNSQDVELLAMLHLNAWDTMAMGNFPYPSNYLTSGGPLLPAWPVRAACEFMADETLTNWDLLAAFNQAGAVFNNATQDVQCYALPDKNDFFQVRIIFAFIFIFILLFMHLV